MRKSPLMLAQFSEIVAHIYDAAADSLHWREALGALREVLTAKDAIAIVRPDTAHPSGLSIILQNHNDETNNLLQYVHGPQCPFASIAPREIATISDLMSEEAWRESLLYRKICEPDGIADILCIEIRLEDRSVYRLRFTRGDNAPRFGQAEKQLASLFLPHLKRAFAMNRAAAGESMIHDRYATACNCLGIAMFVVDRDGKLLHSSDFASTLLTQGDVVRRVGDRLAATHGASDRAFQRMIREALKGTGMKPVQDIMALVRSDGKDAVFVYTQRISEAEGLHAGRRRPTLMIFMRDPSFHMLDAEQLMQRLFQLTHTEASLMMRLANGMSLVEAAEDMNIRHNTARAHLRSIFEKTGSQRQSSLVRLVLNGLAPLGDIQIPPASTIGSYEPSNPMVVN